MRISWAAINRHRLRLLNSEAARGETDMQSTITRRAALAGGVSLMAIAATQNSYAQAKPKFKLSIAVPETDLRAEGYKAFAAAMKDDFEIEPYWSNTLFKQGTELVAVSYTHLRAHET